MGSAAVAVIETEHTVLSAHKIYLGGPGGRFKSRESAGSGGGGRDPSLDLNS